MIEILNAPGYYVYADGRVWSSKSNKYLSPGLGSNGYLLIAPSVNGKNITMYVHILVCTLYHGFKPSDQHEVLHQDNNKLNNHKDNLRWGTKKENQQDRIDQGTYQYGSKNPFARFTENDIMSMRELSHLGVSNKIIAAQYNTDYRTVWAIVTRKRWSHI